MRIDLNDRTREKKINKETKMRNWVYYMQEGLRSMWKKKEVPDYRTVTDEVKFNKSGVPKDFRDREFKGAFATAVKEEEYPYNIEFGDGRTKEEMDKMQKELMEKD